MGIVHHSNYLRFCEEARVDWCKKKGVLDSDRDKREQSVFGLAVYETRVRHIRPSRYDETLKVLVQVKIEGIRMIFQYRILADEKLTALVETIHCNLDANFKVRRLNQDLLNLVEKEKWTETWL